MIFRALVLSVALTAAAAPEAAEEWWDARRLMAQACVAPGDAPIVPDGTTATDAEMVRSQGAIRNFDAAVTAYAVCLGNELSRLQPLHPQDRDALEAARAELNDAAVARAEAVVASFNQALRRHRLRDTIPPKIRDRPAQPMLNRCYPSSIERLDVTVRVTVSATGAVEEIMMPPNLTEPVQKSIRCAVRQFVYWPATYKGVPTASEATLPLMFTTRRSEKGEPLVPAVLLSTEPDIARALDGCRPKRFLGGGQVMLSLTVHKSGRVRESHVLQGSGSRKVDEIAKCAAKRLKYEPGRFQGDQVDVVMVPWNVTVPSGS